MAGWACVEGAVVGDWSEDAVAAGAVEAGAVEAEAVEVGAVDPGEPAAGVALGLAAGFAALPRVSRGGASLSLLSIPTGTSSALRVVFGASAPAGKNHPAPVHGCGLSALLLCRAALMVNSPSDSPACSAS